MFEYPRTSQKPFSCLSEKIISFTHLAPFQVQYGKSLYEMLPWREAIISFVKYFAFFPSAPGLGPLTFVLVNRLGSSIGPPRHGLREPGPF